MFKFYVHVRKNTLTEKHTQSGVKNQVIYSVFIIIPLILYYDKRFGLLIKLKAGLTFKLLP